MKTANLVSLCVLATLLVGCGSIQQANAPAPPPPPAPPAPAPAPAPAPSPPPEPPPPPTPPTVAPVPSAPYEDQPGESSLDLGYAIVRTYFATDRNFTGQTAPAEMFGSGRSRLKYGECLVSIPRDHRLGELEAPSILRLEFREDPQDHVVLLNTMVAPKEQFFSRLGSRIRSSATRSAFLFVHGYNVSFESAARRTAQIAYDIGFDGAPVFYSWPSRGTTIAYPADEQNIEWAQANLRGFLEEFLTRSEAESVFLIAHSMGNRALTRAVASLLSEKPELRTKLTEIILTAPDIDAEVFKRDLVPALAAAGRPITLYASSGDQALLASNEFHGGHPRAGESGAGLLLASGIETIDASAVDTSFLGHSYYAESCSVISDLFLLVRERRRPDQRPTLQRIEASMGAYWFVTPPRESQQDPRCELPVAEPL